MTVHSCDCRAREGEAVVGAVEPERRPSIVEQVDRLADSVESLIARSAAVLLIIVVLTAGEEAKIGVETARGRQVLRRIEALVPLADHGRRIAQTLQLLREERVREVEALKRLEVGKVGPRGCELVWKPAGEEAASCWGTDFV